MRYELNSKVVVGVDKLPASGVLTSKGENKDFARLFPQVNDGIRAAYMKVVDVIEVGGDSDFVLYALESALGTVMVVPERAVLGLMTDVERKTEVGELEKDNLILIKDLAIFSDSVTMGIVKEAMNGPVRVTALKYHCLPDGAHQIRDIHVQTLDKKHSCNISLPKGLKSAIKRGELEVQL